ncbi:hypothetical protein CDEST_07538 [Colletotrichum destructivum]|uniref:Uncharacterized protein n=1 Tax=Colletotrichum destructivum TaxID=34406 RepID=A0AAX4II99_9PEZI|nr:hypothetical protein CDEST_07538 [Colletotrichum destructivum]
MMFIRSLIVAAVVLGASAVPAPSPQDNGTPEQPAPEQPALEQPAPDRCAGVVCPENSYCKVFDFNLEKPVGCEANGTVPADVETCGGVICPTGTTCCNSPCGVCTKPGDFCLTWVC